MNHTSIAMAEHGRVYDERNLTGQRAKSPNIEVCEETGAELFRAGEYAAAGAYVEIETRRTIILSDPDFLPARVDGRVAWYRLARRSRG